VASGTARSSRGRLSRWWGRPVAALPVLVLLAALALAAAVAGALHAARAGLVLGTPALLLVVLVPALRRAWARRRPAQAWPERPTTLLESQYRLRGALHLMAILLGSTFAWGFLAIVLAESGFPAPEFPLLAIVLTAPVFAELDFRLGRRTMRRLDDAAQRLEAAVAPVAQEPEPPRGPVVLRPRGVRALLPGRRVLLTLAPDGLEVPGTPRVPWRDVRGLTLFDLYGQTLLGVTLAEPMPLAAPRGSRLNRALVGFDLTAALTPAGLGVEELVALLVSFAPDVPLLVTPEVL